MAATKPEPGAEAEPDTSPASAKREPGLLTPPSGSFFRLTDIPEDIWSLANFGFEGTGKSLWVMKNMPTPMMVANLDRPITRAHLGMLPRERAEGIFIRNLRENGYDEALDSSTACNIRDDIEMMVSTNLKWLKGGTFLLDGGTMYRDVLKYSDPVIGGKLESGRRFNPKDKASINNYVANLMSYIQDQGINFAITAHAAFSWEMKKVMVGEELKDQLTRTKTVYPKADDIVFERSNLVLLMFKRCQCGKNLVTQDGTCTAITDSQDPRAEEGHQGRRHVTRIVTNKFNTATEGTVWEDLTGETLHILCENPKKAAALMASN